jgi:hypothetical protein
MNDHARPDDGLIEGLHAVAPSGEHADKLTLFGRFVGSWDLEWTGTGPDGQPATMAGELHFGWVLRGRAVQDIWIVPGRGQPSKASRPGRSTAPRSASTTRPSTPGAPPGSSPSTHEYAASSAAPPTATSCSSVTRRNPTFAGDSPTSNRTPSPGAPKPHTTPAPPGNSTSRCSPPAPTGPDPADIRNRPVSVGLMNGVGGGFSSLRRRPGLPVSSIRAR